MLKPQKLIGFCPYRTKLFGSSRLENVDPHIRYIFNICFSINNFVFLYFTLGLEELVRIRKIMPKYKDIINVKTYLL